MPTTPTIEPADSPTAGAVSDPTPSAGRRHPAGSAHTRLLSVLHGDKYMVDAYPPAWRSGTDAAAARRPDGVAADSPQTKER